ncbi:MAG: hypothetical protein RL264_2478 [Bacteroidota bacterium]|jgi:RNA polymerase sigma factor (sigma-70 family)
MDKLLQDAVFAELINRYGKFIFSIIRSKFPDLDDAKDVYQDFSIYLYRIIGEKYSETADLFDTKAWIRAVTSNYCISQLRKKNAKRKVQFVSEEKSEIARMHYSEIDESIHNWDLSDSSQDLNEAIERLFKNFSKRDALMLKMKYYYGKPSSYISRKLNETHVDVYINRLKERVKRRSGIEDVDDFLSRFNTSLK